MKSISFDNPYLLLLIIPAILIIALPFFIAIKRDMRKKSTVASLVIHVVIVLLVALAVSGFSIITVMTETQVYVVADMSYSTSKNIDKIDGYIEELSKNLPINSKLGVVCFAKDQVLLTSAGEELQSVKNANVDYSSTDIASALDYTARLFDKDVIKRIVLITDGKEAGSDFTGRLISTVEGLHSEDISIDAIYIDSNITEDSTEVQISDVEFKENAYLNHYTSAKYLIQSSYSTNAIATLYRGEEKMRDAAVTLVKGYNTFEFELPTDESGEFDYRIEISAEGDESIHNNSMSFTQSVFGNISVLLLSANRTDIEAVEAMYGEGAEIDSYIYNPRIPYDVPCTVEELCLYDEIIISDIDINNIVNSTSFISSLYTSVNLFGKSLITAGNVNLQNKTNEEEELQQLSHLLPVNYGNDDVDSKLYALVLDMSRSMENAERFKMMRDSAIQIINVIADSVDLTSEDAENIKITVVSFAGDVYVPVTKMTLREKDEIIKRISSLEPEQGTAIGAALTDALNDIKGGNYKSRHAILISDGLNFAFERENPVTVAEEMYRNGIVISALQPLPPPLSNGQQIGEGEKLLRNIVSVAGGKYYSVDSLDKVKDVVTGEVADDLTETVIEQKSPVNIVLKADASVEGITSLGYVYGFVYANSKPNVKTVLTVDYYKKNGQKTTSPLYVYRECGNGRVASLMTSLSGEWISDWSISQSGTRFFENIAKTNVPGERNSVPYITQVTFDGKNAEFVMTPATIYPDATVTVVIEDPDNAVMRVSPAFNSEAYKYDFLASKSGKYRIDVNYTYMSKEFTSTLYFNVSYSPEYDSFAIFDPATLYSAIRNRGTVTEEGVPTIENDSKDILTYKMNLTIPLMITAVTLFVIDVIVRKVTLADIKNLFKKKGRSGNEKN